MTPVSLGAPIAEKEEEKPHSVNPSVLKESAAVVSGELAIVLSMKNDVTNAVNEVKEAIENPHDIDEILGAVLSVEHAVSEVAQKLPSLIVKLRRLFSLCSCSSIQKMEALALEPSKVEIV